jgi:UDP-N-acetylmuramate dehydrogenase
MTISENVDLKQYSTMRLGGTARFATVLTHENDIETALMFAERHNCPFKVIGSGSNLIWSDGGFNGLLMINKIEHLTIDNTTAQVTIGAGHDWDGAVLKTVEAGLSGIEFLSLIPGTSGATPVQNVGAYGTEIKDVLVSVRAFDTHQKMFVSIAATDCDFGYRKSRFNQHDAGRFIISEIVLQLSKQPPEPPFYESLTRYLAENSIVDFSPQIIREAVIAVRTAKLPDPDIVANNGSFFANPIITVDHFTKLKQKYPSIVGWQTGNKVKISAAWLIEHAGFKDYHDDATGMATWSKQPLVLVNEHAESTKDLLAFRDKIVQGVREKFDIELIQEPELVK